MVRSTYVVSARAARIAVCTAGLAGLLAVAIGSAVADASLTQQLDAAREELGEVRQLEAGLARTHETTVAEIDTTRARLVEIEARITALGGRQAEALLQLAEAEENLQGLAVRRFVDGGSASSMGLLLGAEDQRDLIARGNLLDAQASVEGIAVERLLDAEMTARSLIGDLVDERADLEAYLAELVTAEAEQASGLALVALARAYAQNTARSLAVRAPVGGTDIPGGVLDAYRLGAEASNAEFAECDLDWALLAGIGWKETGHAHGGRGVRANGDLVPRVLGPVLDGNGFALIVDSDGGKLDGNAEFDRPVGPLQFLPSTWRRFQRDGNGDGVKNVDNVYDAAAAAGAYLCTAAKGGSLLDPAVRRQAILSYNHADWYVKAVVGQADFYRSVVKAEDLQFLVEL